MFRRIVLGITLGSVSLCAQTAHRPTPLTSQGKPAPTKSDDSNARIASLEKRLAELEGKVSLNSYLLNGKQDKNDSAMPDPSSHEFQRLDTTTGSFLVSVSDASPYLNGYRLSLDIGNPSNAKFSNAKLTVRWGPSLASIKDYSMWQSSLHEKQVGLTDDLLAGSWNRVTVDLIPCKSDELGFLEVSLQTPTVSLKTRPSQ